MDETLAVILKDTYSLSQLKHRLRILKANLLKTFFGGAQITETIAPSDLNWLKSLSLAFYQQFSRENVYKLFSDLEEMGLKLDTLTIYLSFEPDDSTLSQIGSFARKTFNTPHLLLDIKIDMTLIAGPALSWKGVYKDYSLRMQLSAKKQELWEGFKKFLR